MIPWFFGCDKVNYARYGSAYWLEMTSLGTTHPDLFNLATHEQIVNIKKGIITLNNDKKNCYTYPLFSFNICRNPSQNIIELFSPTTK